MPSPNSSTATTQPQPQRQEKITPAEAARRLQSVNWAQYWQDVAESSAPDIETYRQARARYLAMASRRVLV